MYQTRKSVFHQDTYPTQNDKKSRYFGLQFEEKMFQIDVIKMTITFGNPKLDS